MDCIANTYSILYSQLSAQLAASMSTQNMDSKIACDTGHIECLLL